MKKTFISLTWLTLAGILALSACAPASSPALTGKDWKLVSYGPPSAQTPAVPNVDTKLTFNTDGNLTGTLGCNSLGGTYTVKDDKITFGPIVSTLMACADPQMKQEGTALQVLKDTAQFKLSGSTLTITSADGINVLTFSAR